MHVYRWDLDKTYLETDFDSIRGLVRSATEPATAKRAVPGATALMRALCHRDGARIFVLSGSPKQLREVLESKLRLDGVRYEQLVLKDSLRHLRKGEVRAIRGQWGYKLPALLRGRHGMGSAVKETLFGDDAEVDALVYSVYADAVAGRLSPRQLSRVLQVAGTYRDHVDKAVSALRKVAVADAVERIFIRLERRAPISRFAPLGKRVVPVFSWWQAALVLLDAGHIEPSDVADVLEAVMSRERRDAWAVAALAQDIVRRGHVGTGLADRLEGPTEVVEAVRRAIGHLGDMPEELPPPSAVPVDYVAVLRAWRS